MKLRQLSSVCLIGTAALLSACNDDTNAPATPPTTPSPAPVPAPTPTPMARSITEFVASLIAMVSGTACDTALPADVNGANLTDDMTSVDANAQTVNCTS